MEKITDLRREIKERLNKKSIINLSELRLKPIDINNSTNKIKNNFNKIMFKIGEALISETLENPNLNEKEKMIKIEELVNIYDIKVKIDITQDYQVERLIKSFKKGRFYEGTNLKIEIKLNDEIAEAYSSLQYEPQKKEEDIFYFKDNPKTKIPFVSFKKIVGTIYFYNNLKKYIESNKDMANLILLKYINLQDIYINLEHKETIINKLKASGFSFTNNTGFFLDVQGVEFVKGIIDGKHYAYLNWNRTEDFFNSLNHIFHKSTWVKYDINAIKYLELTSCFYNFMYELNKEEETEIKIERKISSDYASSYETKKNIPQKTQEEMKKSKFLSHFGYVEYDELVDLDKIKIIEKEWREINKQINFPIAKNHSLRFRRLGKHKASGLYFYNQRAVCIDIKAPSSFIHEVLHTIDYTTLPNTPLSSLFNFRPILERYRDVTNDKINKLDDSNPYKISWNGKGKYNKEYYHNSKEVFARCGEIYIKEVLGINNSLISLDNSCIYPVNDELLTGLIKNYYSSVIETKRTEGNEEILASPSPKVLSKEEIENILDNNQINIFDII